MENTQALKRTLEAFGWAAIFIWWGVVELLNFLPTGTGAVGFGLILIGLNATRALNGIPMSGFTTTLGILALVLGGLELAGPFLHLSFELPIVPILLIVLGVVVLAGELAGHGERLTGGQS